MNVKCSKTFTVLMVVALFTGVSAWAYENNNRSGSSTIEKTSDASITARVKKGLLAHRSTSAVKIKISTKNGVVTIRGLARNETEKALVNKLACDIRGVVSVVNQMTVAEKSGKGVDKQADKTTEECNVCPDLKDAMKCPINNNTDAKQDLPKE